MELVGGGYLNEWVGKWGREGGRDWLTDWLNFYYTRIEVKAERERERERERVVTDWINKWTDDWLNRRWMNGKECERMAIWVNGEQIKKEVKFRRKTYLKKRPCPNALICIEKQILTQPMHRLISMIPHFTTTKHLSQASVLEPCTRLFRLSIALKINQANCLTQLALQRSLLNILHKILDWQSRSTFFKLLGLKI